ncbi:MAG: DUF4842 domain-containing protein, partial [Alistipes sp.]
MKIQLFILLCVAALLPVGCMDTPSDLATQKAVKVSDFESLTYYDVPVKAGLATVVVLDQDTLAVTHVPMHVAVPRYAIDQNALSVTYSQDAIYQNFASSVYWQYISFEDTRKGDYDYNDLVIHCRVDNRGIFENGVVVAYKHTVSVQPVALGGAMHLKLGMLYKENAAMSSLSEAILCQDVRRDIFQGNPIFPINTDPTQPIKKVSSKLTPLFEITNTDPQLQVVWFIETSSNRLYAATTNFGADKSYDMISPDGLPYGISMTKKWDYPIEHCSIREAYPGFDAWIASGNEVILLKNFVKAKVFPAMANGSGNE